jgi:excisionase family DNA binding protein
MVSAAKDLVGRSCSIKVYTSLQATTTPTSPLRAEDVMRAREVASLLHIPVSTVHDWARRGLLPSRKIGRHRLYIRQQIEALLLAAE